MTTPVEIVIKGRDESGGAFASAQGGLAKIGQIAMGILTSQVFTKLAQGVSDFAQSIVTEAREAQEVEAQLNAVIDSTGGIAGVTAEKAKELADALQYQSKYSDEAILSGENMLLTFTNIGKDVFPAATQTILDMSAALGQDVTQSAMQLGKALNDPIQGVSALRRVGVQLTDEQEAQVKQFMAVGDAASAQKVILDELAKEFGGSAKSQTNSIDLLKKRFDNIKEDLGSAILPAIDKFGEGISRALDNPKVQAALETLVTWLGENAPIAVDRLLNIINILSNISFPQLFTTFEDGSNYIGEFFEFFGIGEEKAQLLGSTINSMVGKIQPALFSIFETFEKMRPSIEKTAQVLGDKLVKAGRELYEKVFPFLIVTADKFAAWIAENRPLIEAFATKLAERFAFFAQAVVGFWDVAQPILSGFFDLILGLVELIMEIATGDWAAAWETIKEIVVGVFTSLGEAIVAFLDWIANLMGSSLQEIKTVWTNNWNMLKTIVGQVVNIIRSTISTMLSSIVGFFTSAWNNILSGINNFYSSVVSSMQGIITSIVSTFTNAMGSFVTIGFNIIGAIVQGIQQRIASFTAWIKSVISGIISDVLYVVTGGAVGSSGGGSTSTPAYHPGGTAGGGDVYAGVPVTVGELGRETFVPYTNGRIIPNGAAMSGNVINNYYQPTINNYNAQSARNALRGLT